MVVIAWSTSRRAPTGGLPGFSYFYRGRRKRRGVGCVRRRVLAPFPVRRTFTFGEQRCPVRTLSFRGTVCLGYLARAGLVPWLWYVTSTRRYLDARELTEAGGSGEGKDVVCGEPGYPGL